MPVEDEATVLLAEVRDAAAAAPAHHDQARAVDVDPAHERHEVGELVLVLHEPDGLLESEDDVELGRQALLVHRTGDVVAGVLVGHHRVEDHSDRAGRCAVPLDPLLLADLPREDLLDLLAGHLRERRDGDVHLAAQQRQAPRPDRHRDDVADLPSDLGIVADAGLGDLLSVDPRVVRASQKALHRRPTQDQVHFVALHLPPPKPFPNTPTRCVPEQAGKRGFLSRPNRLT